MEKWFILMWQFIFSFPNEYWKHFPCNIYKHALPSFTFGTFWLSNFSDSGNKPIEYFIQHAYHRMLGEIFDRFKHFQNLQKMTKWQMLDESLFRIILSSNTFFPFIQHIFYVELVWKRFSCNIVPPVMSSSICTYFRRKQHHPRIGNITFNRILLLIIAQIF